MKKMKIIILSILMVCLTTTNVFAGNFSGGFTSAKKKYNIILNESFVNLITAKKAVRRWNKISNNVSLSYGGDYMRNKGINVSIGQSSPPSKTALGQTYYTYKGKKVSHDKKWDLALCIVYSSSKFSKNSKSIQATITHEVGHALSLSHTKGKSDIMKQGVKDYIKLSDKDKEWLKKKWGQ